MITHDEAKTHYGMYSSKNKPRSVWVGPYLVMAHWGNSCWDTLTHKNECNTDFFAVRRVRNLDGVKAFQIVAGRLILTWGKAK